MIKHYKLDMKVTQLVNLVANALVIEKPAEIPVEEVPAPAEAMPFAAEAVGLKGYKILVADDEPDFVTFVSTVLEDSGAEVIKAFDGNQALELARKEKPDLMTLDITMPGKSGIEVFEILRNDEQLANIPVCIMTGKPELRKLIYDRAVKPPEGYVDKPVDEDSIILNIRKILELAKVKEK
ncbi:MAG TPA: response regulator [candidate division Zixibacteria bacterium]|nr:response regulator [candidate division Zixibacteria bacterium]